MKVIGLTGGSGSGKGCVCQGFSKFNINSIDTDKVSRQICEKGSPCLNELVSFFGSQILNSDNSLNRKALASIVFSDKEKLSVLNSITHRYILDTVRKWLAEQKKSGKSAAIVDAPLLYESGFYKECDVIIAVVSDRALRTKRIIARDSLTPDDADKRLSNQGDDTFYTQKADYVITNNGTLEELDIQIEKIYTSLFDNN